MSDVTQGPGWWIASDGNWYPPELHPDVLATAVVAATSVAFEGGAHNVLGQVPVSWGLSDSDVRQENVVVPVPGPGTTQGDIVGSASTPSSALADFSSHSQVARAAPRPRKLVRARSPWIGAIAAVLIVGGILTFSLTQDSGPSITSDSPGQLLALASSAARTAGSVHVTVRIQVPGQTATYINDSTAGSGRQVITSSGGVRVTSLVLAGTAYVNANRVGMTTLFQSPAAVAQKYANTWLSFSSKDPAYKQIAESVTLSSLLKEVTPQGTVTKLRPSTVIGQSVVGVHGRLPGGLGGTLYISQTGSPLPIEEISRASGGTTTAIFSDWGQSVALTPPAHSIPGSSVPSLIGSPGTVGNDRAAQSNVVNALTELLALYQTTGQSFCEVSCANGVNPMTLATIQSSAPEFTWSNGAVRSGNDVSIQPVDVTTPGGRGDGVILAVMSESTNTCWYEVDLENSPGPAFTDTAPNVDFSLAPTANGSGQWEAPTGGSAQKLTAGVFYAKATIGGLAAGSPTPSQGRTAGFPVGKPTGGPTTWKWGPSFSSAPNL